MPRDNVSPPKKESTALAVKRLAGEGLSCRAIAKELGLSPSTVSRHAKAVGVSFDRSATVAATEAKKADAAERLVSGADRWLDARDELIGALLTDVSLVNARDAQSLMIAAGVAQDKAAASLSHAKGADAGVGSLLSDVMDGLREKWGTAPPDQEDTSGTE